MTAKQSKDSRLRSVCKGLTWRVLATLTTYLLAWLFTGDVAQASQIAAVEFFLKFAVYYLHERAWQWFDVKKPSIAEGSERELK